MFANLWSEAGWNQASQTFKDNTILSCQFIPNIKVGTEFSWKIIFGIWPALYNDCMTGPAAVSCWISTS